MESKRYTEVLIDGKIYTLGGDGDEAYMQRVAGYINEKTSSLRHKEGFNRQNADYQQVMIELNMADDYFQAKDQITLMEQQKREVDKEVYSLKHELVTAQMKLEAARQELAAWKASVKETEAGSQPAETEQPSGTKPPVNQAGTRQSGKNRRHS